MYGEIKMKVEQAIKPCGVCTENATAYAARDAGGK